MTLSLCYLNIQYLLHGRFHTEFGTKTYTGVLPDKRNIKDETPSQRYNIWGGIEAQSVPWDSKKDTES